MRHVATLRLAIDRSSLLLLTYELTQCYLIKNNITPLLRLHKNKVESILKSKIRFNFDNPNDDRNSFKPTPESTYSLIKKLLSQLNTEIKTSLVISYEILQKIIPGTYYLPEISTIQITRVFSPALDTLTSLHLRGIEQDIYYMRRFSQPSILAARFKPEQIKIIQGYVNKFNLVLAFFALSCETFLSHHLSLGIPLLNYFMIKNL